jgi:hypothetical protein
MRSPARTPRLRICRPRQESVTPEQIGDAIVDFLGAARVLEILSGARLRALDGGTTADAGIDDSPFIAQQRPEASKIWRGQR